MKQYLYLITVFLIAGLLATSIGLTKNHWWIRTKTPKVFFNGEEMPDSEVFVSINGDYLLDVKKDNKNLGAYTILKNEKIVGLTSPNELVRLPWCYFVWTDPIPVSPIGTQAAYLTAKVKFEDQRITFTVPINEDMPRETNTIEVQFR